jgi:DNA-binding NarL/FixJ family response regulator
VSEPETAPATASVLYLGRDLFFSTRVAGTVRELGGTVRVAISPKQATTMLASAPARLVLVDLADAAVLSPGVLDTIREAAAGAALIGFGPHVDTATLNAAKAAGFHRVMARSAFTAELPELIRQALTPAIPDA